MCTQANTYTLANVYTGIYLHAHTHIPRLYVHACTHVYVGIHLHAHTRIHGHIPTCTHTYTQAYTYMSTHIYTGIHLHAHTHLHRHIPPCTHMYTQVYTYTHANIYTGIHLHAHTQTYTQACTYRTLAGGIGCNMASLQWPNCQRAFCS